MTRLLDNFKDSSSQQAIRRIVGDDVKLKKAGADFPGFPFMPRRPSFSVHATRQFISFGCGSGGCFLLFRRWRTYFPRGGPAAGPELGRRCRKSLFHSGGGCDAQVRIAARRCMCARLRFFRSVCGVPKARMPRVPQGRASMARHARFRIGMLRIPDFFCAMPAAQFDEECSERGLFSWRKDRSRCQVSGSGKAGPFALLEGSTQQSALGTQQLRSLAPLGMTRTVWAPLGMTMRWRARRERRTASSEQRNLRAKS